MLLMIDNYDSFTYNLVQYFQRLNQEVLVKRNDEISVAQIKQLNPKHIVISPGPCTPNEAGVSLNVVEQLKGIYPILAIRFCDASSVIKSIQYKYYHSVVTVRLEAR